MDPYTLTLQRRFEVAAGAMFLYEYLLTLDLEVQYFWRSRWTAATVLFFGNRYMNILTTMCSILGIVMKTNNDLVCGAIVMTKGAGFALAQVLLLLFSLLRIYAITDRAWTPTVIVFVIGIVPPILTMYTYVCISGYATPGTLHGCSTKPTHLVSTSQYNTILIIIRTCITLNDLLVLLAVLRVVGIPWTTTRLAVDPRIAPVTTSLLRNSLVFFLLMVLINTAQIIASAMRIRYAAVGVFLSPLTSIFITRMLLHLRQANRALDDDFLSIFVRADMEHTATTRSEHSLRFSPGIRWSAERPLSIELLPMRPVTTIVSASRSHLKDASY